MSWIKRTRYVIEIPCDRLRIGQVEYKPCCRVADGLAMIEAFLPSIDEGGTFVPSSDLRDPAIFGVDPQFSVKHTALQMTELFSKVFA